MLSLFCCAVVGFLAGIGTGALICKFKCNKPKACEPLIDVDEFWDPGSASIGADGEDGSPKKPTKRKSKGKRKGK